MNQSYIEVLSTISKEFNFSQETIKKVAHFINSNSIYDSDIAGIKQIIVTYNCDEEFARQKIRKSIGRFANGKYLTFAFDDYDIFLKVFNEICEQFQINNQNDVLLKEEFNQICPVYIVVCIY